MFHIRNATIDDSKAILDIYAPYITDTCVSFETQVPTIGEFRLRVKEIINSYPYIVCEDGNDIIGFAYASRHRERAAYKYSAEVSVYVSPAYHRCGIGKSLYMELFELLKTQDVCMVFAGITLPNDKSVGLHKAFEFKEVGVYHNAGYKFGEWLDVLWMEKLIRKPLHL